MAIGSINPFAIGNYERSLGASTFQPVRPIEPKTTSAGSEGFKGFASIEDIEKAQQFINGNIDLSSSQVNRSASNNPIDNRGAAWEGFNTPTNNGTGELMPKYEEGEKIFDCIA